MINKMVVLVQQTGHTPSPGAGLRTGFQIPVPTCSNLALNKARHSPNRQIPVPGLSYCSFSYFI